MSKVLKIHPSIGVSRVGTSEQFYIAPETAGGLPTDPSTGKPVTSFRDADGALLKQAARFRVFAYDSKKPKDGGTELKVGAGGVKAIEWTVYVANKKAVWYEFKQLTGSGQEGDPGYIANGPVKNPLRNKSITDPAQRQQLILDPGPRTIGGGNPKSASFDLTGPATDPARMLPHPIKSLGSIQLDSNGNLLVLAGNGASGTTNINPAGSQYQYEILEYANNDGWFDGTADGPVTATVVMDDGTRLPVDVPAWSLCGVPKFAPQILNLVTMYDRMYDIAVRYLDYAPDLYSDGTFNLNYKVDFATEIAPILSRPGGYRWVANIPPVGVKGHGALPGDGPAAFPFSIVRSPAAPNADDTRMPILAGDNPLSGSTPSKYGTVTPTQYFLLGQWVGGQVRKESTPTTPRAAQLDQAALENCVGGSFCPGIEMGWIGRNPTIYADAFRIKVKGNVKPGALSQTYGNDNDYRDGLEPGDATKYMAQPWQADFNECSTQDIGRKTFWWWPAQRPYSVYAAAPIKERVAWTRGFAPDPDGLVTTKNPNLGDMQMVINWTDLGFIVKDGDVFLERERNTAAIDAYKPPLKTARKPLT